MEGNLCYYTEGNTAATFSLPRSQVIIGSEPGCGLPIDSPSVEPRHALINWSQRQVCWEISCIAPQASIQVGGREWGTGAKPVLLYGGEEIMIGGYSFRFERRAAPPSVNSKPIEAIRLSGRTVILGREDGSEAAVPEGTTRWELDPEDKLVSRDHVRLVREPSGYVLLDCGRGASQVNGDLLRGSHRLVYGDRISLGCYVFEFLGDELRCVDPVSGGSVQARELSVIVSRPRSRKILDSVSLDINSGEFVGILGGSGQGKSTLIHALCGMSPATKGRVFINGLELENRRQMRSLSLGFVPQDDIVHRELTVRQAITYSARLRLRIPRHAIESIVTGTIERLNLTAQQHQRISSLSGGQRKRVSIATELIVKPAALFLDEPSSGLDPDSEFRLMTLLKSLSRTGITVVCTTHMLENAQLFRRLCFVHGGRLVFFGTPDEARRHFFGESAPLTTPLADIYRQLLERETRDGKEQFKVTAEQWEEKFKVSEPATRLTRQTPPALPTSTPPAPRRPGYLRSLLLLLSRQWKILIADRLNLGFLLAQAIVIGLLVGWVSDDPGFRMFLCLIATLWFGCSNGAQQIVAELPVFRRERISGLGLHTYAQSKFLFLSLITVVQSLLLFGTIIGIASIAHPSDENFHFLDSSVVSAEDRQARDQFFKDPKDKPREELDTYEAEAFTRKRRSMIGSGRGCSAALSRRGAWPRNLHGNFCSGARRSRPPMRKTRRWRKSKTARER